MTVLTPTQTTQRNIKVTHNGAPHPQRVTLEEYWAFFYEHPDHNYEYNNGLLEMVAVAKKFHIDMFTWFLALLRRYLEVNPIAVLSMLEIGFKMEQAGKIQVRKPDVGVVLNSNPIPFENEDHRYHGIFDLCVEMVSDSSRHEIERDTVVKFGEYEAAGVKEYWLLSDDEQILALYRLNEQGRYARADQPPTGVWESTVLPGFRLRVSDLFTMPPLSSLVDDPIYANFAFPQFLQERQMKTAALKRAEKERQMKETALKRAEQAEQQRKQVEQERDRLAEFLRQQGFDPEALL